MTTPTTSLGASPLLPATTASTKPAAASDCEQLAGVAKQFEAIFLRQMLSAARKSGFGEDKIFSGQGLDTFRQMQDERFADIAADTGAFGLAKMIETHLARFVSADAGASGTSPETNTGTTAVKQEAPADGI